MNADAPGHNFTQRVRAILHLAHDEAGRRGHEEVTPMHLAWGMVTEGESVAAAVLANLGVDLSRLLADIEALLPPGDAPGSDPGALRYSAEGKRVIEQAMAEARALRHSYVGAEHCLLALLRDAAGPVAHLFAKHGVAAANATTGTLHLLGAEQP